MFFLGFNVKKLLNIRKTKYAKNPSDDIKM